MGKEAIRCLIQFQNEFDGADAIIEAHTDCKTPSEKLRFLQSLFGDAADADNDDSTKDSATYRKILTRIVKHRYNLSDILVNVF